MPKTIRNLILHQEYLITCEMDALKRAFKEELAHIYRESRKYGIQYDQASRICLARTIWDIGYVDTYHALEILHTHFIYYKRKYA